MTATETDYRSNENQACLPAAAHTGETALQQTSCQSKDAYQLNSPPATMHPDDPDPAGKPMNAHQQHTNYKTVANPEPNDSLPTGMNTAVKTNQCPPALPSSSSTAALPVTTPSEGNHHMRTQDQPDTTTKPSATETQMTTPPAGIHHEVANKQLDYPASSCPAAFLMTTPPAGIDPAKTDEATITAEKPAGTPLPAKQCSPGPFKEPIYATVELVPLTDTTQQMPTPMKIVFPKKPNPDGQQIKKKPTTSNKPALNARGSRPTLPKANIPSSSAPAAPPRRPSTDASKPIVPVLKPQSLLFPVKGPAPVLRLTPFKDSTTSTSTAKKKVKFLIEAKSASNNKKKKLPKDSQTIQKDDETDSQDEM